MNPNSQYGSVRRFDPLMTNSGGGGYGAPSPRASQAQVGSFQPPPGGQQQPLRATPDQLAYLQNQGFPAGMIQAIINTKDLIPVRIWLLDNSLFMNEQDAHAIQPDYTYKSCSRWDELRSLVHYHADFIARFGMQTRFALVNNPGVAPQYFSLCQTGNLAQEQQVLSRVMTTVKPNGPTTLTAQIRTLQQYVTSMAAGLSLYRHTVTVVLVTQGLPTNEKGETSPQITQDFIDALRDLEKLPVWVVLRICSDDEKAFEFYNAMDQQVNLQNDVLDDFYGEALEVYLRNPWLCYAIVLHRYREAGFRSPFVDSLDERTLTLLELRGLGQFLFGTNLPDPTLDFNLFLRALEVCMARERPHWNPIFKKVTPWIDLGLLNSMYAPRHTARQSVFGSQTVPPPPVATASGPRPATAAPGSTPAESPSATTPTTPTKPASTTQELSKQLDQMWAKQPTNPVQNRDIAELLGTIQDTFKLVEPHECFTKYRSMSKEALNQNDPAVLKRAVRKMRLFLHPDKLPSDLNERQQHLCRSLWDTISEAWEAHEARENKP